MFKRDRTKGFTLVELLLVLAILGIISAVAIPSFLSQRRRAREVGDAQSNTRVIQMALESIRAEMGFYGKEGTYEYKYKGDDKGDDTGRPTGADDIIPTFSPKGNTKMDYTITIGNNGLTYEIKVYDPVRKYDVLTANQTGEIKIGGK
jgi:prepilin-type N-terminal cleavage/methylation domain-containing protein